MSANKSTPHPHGTSVPNSLGTKVPHPHAESMMMYAQDAMETDKPWERWECSDDQEDWIAFTTHPAWLHDLYYRRKPRTIMINCIEVPEPVRKELETGQVYWITVPTNRKKAIYNTWHDDEEDTYLLDSGLIHLTEENARKHAEALLSFTRK